MQKNCDNVTDNVTDTPQNVTDSVTHTTFDKEERYRIILQMMRTNPRIFATELSKELHVTPMTIKRDISQLKENKMIRRIGNERNGYWEILIT